MSRNFKSKIRIQILFKSIQLISKNLLINFLASTEFCSSSIIIELIIHGVSIVVLDQMEKSSFHGECSFKIKVYLKMFNIAHI